MKGFLVMKIIAMLFCWSILDSAKCFSEAYTTSNRSFSVDYDHNTFMKDGKPFRYISGCMHYFRIPRVYWSDRIRKMKACGLDAIETYIPWNFHWQESNYDFTGQRDVVAFLNMVHEEGMVAIVRGFPYSDTEWDMGGLPFWLLKTEYNPPSNPIALRTHHPKFMSALKKWLDVILPKIKPLLYNNNGPIIMVQVENEYGSYYAHDVTYMKSLYNMMDEHLEQNVVLFTTDGNSGNDLQHGGIPGALQTVDFGPGSDPKSSFAILRKYQPNGPIVNSEYYTGWLDHWGEASHHRTSSKSICATFDAMLNMSASVNFYMFAGGTNFGYWSGSNSPPFKQITTSYDYDSPINENGDTTEKYFRIREIISKYKTLPSMPIPANISRISYGKIPMAYVGNIWDHLTPLCHDGFTNGTSPKSFEDLSALGGYVLYIFTVPTLSKEYEAKDVTLVFEEKIHDYAQVYINELQYVGSLDRDNNQSITLGHLTTGDHINILVESQGRICYGSQLNDSKGIRGKVTLKADNLDDISINHWSMCHLHLENLAGYDFKKGLALKSNTDGTNIPGIYYGEIDIPTIADTFVDFSEGNWTSGYIITNGFNLGKYEPKKGPQKTLYLPTKSVSSGGKSLPVIIFETRPTDRCATVGNACMINLVDSPSIG